MESAIAKAIPMERHGYDGDPPQFVPFRDIGGEGVREIGIFRKIDRLEWLHSHKLIETHQRDAGRRLQADCEQAEFRGYTTLGSVKGGSGTNRLSDVRCDAIGRVNSARLHVAGIGWRMLELVVIENVSLAKAERRLRLRRDSGIGLLLGALDTLAHHYGLA